MRYLVIIPLLMATMCSGQNPDLEGYSIELFEQYKASYQEIIDSLIDENDSLKLEVANKDCLAMDSVIVMTDTFNIQVLGSESSGKLTQEFNNIKTRVIHGTNRINVEYTPDHLDILVMDSTFTRYSSHVDLRNGY